MKTIQIQYYATSYADFMLGTFEDQICLLDFRDRKARAAVDKRLQKGLGAEYVEQDHPLLQATRQQIQEYLLGQRQVFTLPLLMVGTDFQKKVWHALLQIPYGETRSYLSLAQSIGIEKAVRAVANANGANAMSLIIPCHRIIGSQGQPVGYAGGIALKQRLLALEKVSPAQDN